MLAFQVALNEFYIRKAVLPDLPAYCSISRMILTPHNHLIALLEIHSIVDDRVGVRPIPTESKQLWFDIQLRGDEGPRCLDGEHERLDTLLDGDVSVPV